MAEHGIVPAYQGLETDDPTLRHIHLGLIAQAELPPTDGLGQELLEGQLAMQALLHAGGEALPAKPPHLLGLVHGHVGTGDEVVAVIRVVRVDGDADAAADGDLGDTAQLQWLAHLGEHEIRHLLGPIARLVEGHQGGELVPAKARQLHVPRADLLEPSGDPLQQAIPGLVAVVVIDQLEVVQIHEHQGKAPPEAAIGFQGFHQAVAVEQPGEGVVPGQVAMLQLFELAIRDVPHGQQDPCPLLDMAKLVLEPAHPLLGATLPFGHHFVQTGEATIEGLVRTGEDLGQRQNAGAKAHVEVMVAALEAPLVVKETGQGVAGGEGGLLIEGVGIDDRFRHHHLPSGKLDPGKTQIDLLLDPLG